MLACWVSSVFIMPQPYLSAEPLKFPNVLSPHFLGELASYIADWGMCEYS